MAVSQTLLSDKTYDIEFNGYLSNHAKHAIVALDRLNAPEPRIQEWWDAYTALTPYSLTLHKVSQQWDAVEPCTPQEWEEWRGKHIGWQEMCAFLQKDLDETYKGDTKKLVQKYAPPLLAGMAGGLTHGIIHLGWAIDGNSPWMIIEGLAYLNYCYVGIDKELKIRAVEESSPLESLARIAKVWKEDNLAEDWIANTKAKYDESFHPELVPAGFQWQLAKVLHEPHSVATDLPSWLDKTPLDKLLEELYRTVTYVYLSTRDENNNGSFLVLHAITSLWALEHTLQMIGDDSVSRKAFGEYYAMLICILAAGAGGFPEIEAIQKVVDGIPADAVDALDLDWAPMVTAGIAEEEEHNIKLVYVMRELWGTRYGNWHGFSETAKAFTLTPNIGPQATAFKD